MVLLSWCFLVVVLLSCSQKTCSGVGVVLMVVLARVLELRLTCIFESFVKACSGMGVVLMVVLARVL